jgi:bifunctional non-homologous end joining protein LigD
LNQPPVVYAATLAGTAPPPTARAAPLPSRVAFQLVTSSHEPPAGDGWLYEIKHDGHRLAVITDGAGGLRLLSRNGYERSRLFGAVFRSRPARPSGRARR